MLTYVYLHLLHFRSVTNRKANQTKTKCTYLYFNVKKKKKKKERRRRRRRRRNNGGRRKNNGGRRKNNGGRRRNNGGRRRNNGGVFFFSTTQYIYPTDVTFMVPLSYNHVNQINPDVY